MDLSNLPSTSTEDEADTALSSPVACDPVVCRCYGVTESTIVAAVRSGRALDVDSLTAVTKAGDGCTCCHKKLCKLIERHR